MSLSTKKTRRFVSAVLALIMIISVAAMAIIPASAVTNQAVNECADGVFLIRAIPVASGTVNYEGSTYKFNRAAIGSSSGTAFLINDYTVLTCAHVVDPDMWEGSELYEEMEFLASLGLNIEIDYEIVVTKDVTKPCTINTKSEADDYAIMNLSQSMGGSKVLPLLEDAESLTKKTDTVYTIGFPGTVEDVEILAGNEYNRANDSSDVTIADGTVQKVTNLNNTDVFQHSATTKNGNSGGPLVNEEGAVIGVCKWGVNNQEYYWATAINEVIKVLKKLKIEYTPFTGSIVAPTEAEEDNKIEEVETEPQVIAQIETETEPTPEPKDNTLLIVAIAALVVILVAVVIVIVIMSSKKKKGNTQPPAGPGMPGGPAAPGGMPGGMNAGPRAPQAPQPYNRPPMPPQNSYVPSNEGAGETSVLSEGAGETTVLGGQSTGMALIRKSNGEKIAINKPEFTIGKERRRVDYCISDNNSISRAHAKLRVRSGRCYISDLGSTNCTFVNGTKLSPNQEVILSKGDSIKLSDEEFTFEG